MGLIRAALGAAGGVMADQWKEYFYCESIPENILAVKGHHRTTKRGGNKKGSDNIISNGSVIAVADGQCMILVDQGKVTEVCAEPGEFQYDASSEPSLFAGDLQENIAATFKNIGKRFTFGGEAPKDQRIYYLNMKELVGNKYGTPSPVPFRVVDERAGIDMDITIRCFGEYSYHICDPILFYTNVCGNVTGDYTRDRLEPQLRTELLTALQPAFGKISDMGIRYSALPGHTAEIADALNTVLSDKWRKLRGIEIVSFGVSSVKASEEDEKMIRQMQQSAAYRDPTLAASKLVNAQANAMEAAASNQNAGPAMAFMGMNMASNAGGINAQDLYQMGAQQAASRQPGATNQQAGAAGQQTAANRQPGTTNQQSGASAGLWNCPNCGKTGIKGNFCPECGNPKPVQMKPRSSEWTCPNCGGQNTGKFCSECGQPRPQMKPKYRCSSCGWEPEDPTSPPKFCPNCGNAFGEEDIIS